MVAIDSRSSVRPYNSLMPMQPSPAGTPPGPDCRVIPASRVLLPAAPLATPPTLGVGAHSRAAGPGRGAGPAWYARRSAVELTADELLHGLAGVVVAVLLGRRLHEVTGCGQDRATDAAV